MHVDGERCRPRPGVRCAPLLRRHATPAEQAPPNAQAPPPAHGSLTAQAPPPHGAPSQRCPLTPAGADSRLDGDDDGPTENSTRALVESPIPDLPRGAGGPRERAAGRGTGTLALVAEPDPLLRLLVGPAVEHLGFVVVFGTPGPASQSAVVPGRPAVVFVPLDRFADCRAARRDATAGGSAAVVVGYGRGPAMLLSAHRAHACCDLVLQLLEAGGRARLRHLPAADAVSAAGLSAREADVLVLLLGGLTTPDIAARLGVAECTARSHCRAVLRKIGVGDRRELRAALLTPEHQVCRALGASFAKESAVAQPGARHPYLTRSWTGSEQPHRDVR